MNLAFSALLIALLAAPGAFFVGAYRRGWWRKPVAGNSFQSDVFLYLAWSVPVHLLAGWLFRLLPCLGGAWSWVRLSLHQRRLTEYSCDLRPIPLSPEDLLTLMIGAPAPRLSNAVSAAADSVADMALYFLVAAVTAVLIGVIAHSVVRRFSLDVWFPLLNPQPSVWFLFSGNRRHLTDRGYWTTDETAGQPEPDFVLITLSIDVGGTSYLYFGVLRDYDLSRHGRLERVMLSDVQRRRIDDDREDQLREGKESETDRDERFYTIRGDTMVFEYDRVLSMNIEYVDIAVDPDEEYLLTLGPPQSKEIANINRE